MTVQNYCDMFKSNLLIFTFSFLIVNLAVCQNENSQEKLWELNAGVNLTSGNFKRGKGTSNSSGITEQMTSGVGWSAGLRRMFLISSKVNIESGLSLQSLSFLKTTSYPSSYLFWPRALQERMKYTFGAIDSRLLIPMAKRRKVVFAPFAGLGLQVLLNAESRRKIEINSSGNQIDSFVNYKSFEEQINISISLGLKIKYGRTVSSIYYQQFAQEQFSPTPPGRLLKSICFEMGYKF